MNVTKQTVEHLAQQKGYRFAGPGARLDGYDYYLYYNKDDGRPSLRVALMSFDIGDVCRFLGLDGVISYEGGAAGPRLREVPTIRHLFDAATGETERIEGPVPAVTG